MDPLLGSGQQATTEVLLEAVFSMWSGLRLYHSTDQFELVSAVQCSGASAVKWSELVGEWLSCKIVTGE
jgi:hypothetical protein